MLRGLYTSAAAMLGQLDRQDAIANNLANVNTPGYKRKVVSFNGFALQLQSAVQANQSAGTPTTVPIGVLYEDRRQGGLQDTGSRTSFALDGPGYFVLQADKGEHLVRGGSFRLDGSGQLVNNDGLPVLGERGPIQVAGSNWSVDGDGTVTSDGTAVGKLRIERTSNDPAKPTRVVQGSLETANVNTVEEMVSMITALRSYEACQKSIQNLDQTLDKLINQMGR